MLICVEPSRIVSPAERKIKPQRHTPQAGALSRQEATNSDLTVQTGDDEPDPTAMLVMPRHDFSEPAVDNRLMCAGVLIAMIVVALFVI